MACHNERVARTRKHAEAKRNRQARKDRDNGSSSTSAPRSSRSRIDRLPTDAGERTAELPELPSAPSHVGELSASPPPPQVRPLPPSPGPTSSSYGRAPSFDNGAAHQRAQTTPGDAPRHTPALPLAPSASSQSIAALSRSASPLHPPLPPLSHARTASQLSEEHPHPPRRASASGLRNEFGAAGAQVGASSGSASSPRRPSGDYHLEAQQRDPYSSSYPARPESPLPPPVPTLSSDALGPSLPDKQGRPAPALGTTSSASLAAPTMSKSERRRSGFYGAQARPSLGDEAISAQLGGTSASSNGVGEAPPLDTLFAPSTTPPNPPAHPHPHPHPHSHAHAPSSPYAPSSSDDLHTSMSFYDPDTLLFLNHVGGAPSSSSAPPGAGDKALPDPTLSLNDEAIERLGTPSPAPSNVASGDDATDDDTPLGAIGGGSGGNGVARRVRESIRLQKRESEGRASEGTGPGSAPLSVAGLDVELVEMLLAELEATKKEMKEIKSRYNAFRVRLSLSLSCLPRAGGGGARAPDPDEA